MINIAATLGLIRSQAARSGSVVATDTIRFTGASLVSNTPGITVISSKDFKLFVNGQYIPDSMITSIGDVGANVDAVVNTSLLGYDLTPNHYVSGVGKFKT